MILLPKFGGLFFETRCSTIRPTELVRTSGLLCSRSDDVKPTAETSGSCPQHHRTFIEDIFWCTGAILAELMRYRDWCFTY